MGININKRRPLLEKLLAELPEPHKYEGQATAAHVAGWTRALYSKKTPGSFDDTQYEAGRMAANIRKKSYKTTIIGLDSSFQKRTMQYNCRLAKSQIIKACAASEVLRDINVISEDTLTGAKSERFYKSLS